MAIESFLLPAPVTVYQTFSTTCWAACYQSLLQTNGSHLSFTEIELRNLFDHDYISGVGLTGRGIIIEAHLAGMVKIRAGRGSSFDLRQIWEALQFGYVLFVYNLPDADASHMVVAFGVESGGIYVMNPNRMDYTFLTVEYLRKLPVIWFARPIFPTMIANPFNAVR